MKTNPIVAFVVPDSIGVSDDAFPIGWTADEGQRQLQVGTDQKNYLIIFLNDRLAVQPIHFANKHPDKALLVITHINSELNRAWDVPTNRELKSWGRPIVCASYHRREEGYPAWQAIESLFSKNLSASEFSKMWRGQHKLDTYESLVVLCQIKILNPAYVGSRGDREGWNEIWAKTVGELSGELEDELKLLGYQERIVNLRSRASE